MSIISVENVTKEYTLGQLKSLKHTMLNTLGRFGGKTIERQKPFKALDDVSFSIDPGEVIGVIGTNGAGKSTLLKILARISVPTRGNVSVKGTVAPLIEVGAGLIGDLTGRENVFINGAILGLSRETIRKKFDEIVSFAELEEFIDTPVKRYSSGMAVRLGFSIATAVDADILIVDEVLAVGDLAFQRKCFNRMEDLITKQGKTVLLVSHNIRQVERLCNRVLLFNNGKIIKSGKSREVCNYFYDLSDKKIKSNHLAKGNNTNNIQSSGDIDLLSIQAFTPTGQPVTSIEYFANVKFMMTFDVKNKLTDPVFGFGVHTTDMLYLATNQSIDALDVGELDPGIYEVWVKIDRFPFLPGIYSVRVGVALKSSFQPIFYAENMYQIQVSASDVSRSVVSNKSEGFVGLDASWCFNSADHCNRG